MDRTTLNELKARRVDDMSPQERDEFNAAYQGAKLALEVGEQIRDAREAAGFTQRELASRMGTSQAAIARLEAGAAAPTLTTLQKAAAALDLTISVELSAVHA